MNLLIFSNEISSSITRIIHEKVYDLYTKKFRIFRINRDFIKTFLNLTPSLLTLNSPKAFGHIYLIISNKEDKNKELSLYIIVSQYIRMFSDSYLMYLV